MKSIYKRQAKRYEDIVKTIVTDADLDIIDFPLVANNFDFDKLSTILPQDIVQKLGGLVDEAEPFTPDFDVKKKDEEFKEGELEDLKNATTKSAAAQ